MDRVLARCDQNLDVLISQFCAIPEVVARSGWSFGRKPVELEEARPLASTLAAKATTLSPAQRQRLLAFRQRVYDEIRWQSVWVNYPQYIDNNALFRMALTIGEVPPPNCEILWRFSELKTALAKSFLDEASVNQGLMALDWEQGDLGKYTTHAVSAIRALNKVFYFGAISGPASSYGVAEASDRTPIKEWAVRRAFTVGAEAWERLPKDDKEFERLVAPPFPYAPSAILTNVARFGGQMPTLWSEQLRVEKPEFAHAVEEYDQYFLRFNIRHSKGWRGQLLRVFGVSSRFTRLSQEAGIRQTVTEHNHAIHRHERGLYGMWLPVAQDSPYLSSSQHEGLETKDAVER